MKILRKTHEDFQDTRIKTYEKMRDQAIIKMWMHPIKLWQMKTLTRPTFKTFWFGRFRYSFGQSIPQGYEPDHWGRKSIGFVRGWSLGGQGTWIGLLCESNGEKALVLLELRKCDFCANLKVKMSHVYNIQYETWHFHHRIQINIIEPYLQIMLRANNFILTKTVYLNTIEIVIQIIE